MMFPAVFLERVNRFVARVRMEDGTERLVHVASSGRMADVLQPGLPAAVAGTGKPGQKTTGLLAMVRNGETWVSVDTSVPGKLLRQAFTDRTLKEFSCYTQVRPEFCFGESRLDFLLTAPGQLPCLVEVKSVTSVLQDPDGVPVARFPDAPTARGTRHLKELAAAVLEGYRAAVCFIVQRDDAAAFGPWETIDPAFSQTLREVMQQGVEVRAWSAHVSPAKIILGESLSLRV